MNSKVILPVWKHWSVSYQGHIKNLKRLEKEAKGQAACNLKRNFWLLRKAVRHGSQPALRCDGWGKRKKGDATNSLWAGTSEGSWAAPSAYSVQLRTCKLPSQCRKGQRAFLSLMFRNAFQAKTWAFLEGCRDVSFLHIISCGTCHDCPSLVISPASLLLHLGKKRQSVVTAEPASAAWKNLENKHPDPLLNNKENSN